MIRALFLIFEPVAAWDRVINARRGVGFLFLFYLMPMILIVAALEGFGLMEWGRPQWSGDGIHKFTTGEMLAYEIAQSLGMIVIVFICAQIVKAFGNASYPRHTFAQGFTVAVCGLSPLFLLRLLDVFPAINPWLIWAIGIMLCVSVLYHGVPRVMQPDPSQTFGLYFMCAVMFVLVTGLERFIAVWYLAGKLPQINEIFSHYTKHL